jgi:RNA 3'-terminal phosphate cyclase (ATP)
VREHHAVARRQRRTNVIEIDGSEGEGGGQILRSALSLAICTQQPFRITNIRANRERPGLLRQHLTAVMAAADISAAEVDEAEIGARRLTFRPGRLASGDYSFAIGTAGSCTLVFQTVLPALLTAAGESRVRITGGTHNPASPPFDFLARSFLPLLGRMGAEVQLELASYGFYPRGGGEIRARITPGARLKALNLQERGAWVRGYAEAYVAALPLHVAQRELEVIGRTMGWTREQLLLRGLPNDVGPGNALTITLEHENVVEVFTGFGERGVRAEIVAGQAASAARDYLSKVAPVGEYLADQLLLPMALGEGGSFVTSTVTPHLRSNAAIIERFTQRNISIEPVAAGYAVKVG